MKQSLNNFTSREMGAYLLTKPFRTWFRFAFKSVEGKKFIVDKVHEKTFELFEQIFNQEPGVRRVCLNQPPRSGKTRLMLYFFPYASLCSPCNFIYTTFSAQLLKDARDVIKSIVESDFFKSYYGGESFCFEEEKLEFIDDVFKKEYETQGVKFTNTKIRMGNSYIYLTPLGSTTGLGAGIMGAERYSGGVFMDDINKVTDTLTDKTLNQKVRDYYSTNILTRFNNAESNVLNTQQRISESDLSQYLLTKYDFNKVEIPLLNEDGSCNIESQYTTERIEELKRDNKTWMAQYQQKPIEATDLTFSGQMFEPDILKEAAKRNVPYELNPFKVMGVDPKREGTDNFAIVLREGKYVRVLHNSKKAYATQEAVDLIIAYFERWRPEYVCCDSGKGEGIIDELLRLGYPVREIKFNGESHRKDCVNKRAAMYKDILDWIISGGVLPDNHELIEDLAIQEYAKHEGNLVKLAAKEEIKKRIGRSPGLSDALALTFGVKAVVLQENTYKRMMIAKKKDKTQRFRL